MRITRIEATTHRIPAVVPLLAKPVVREFVFVRVETDAGLVGYGLTGPIQRFAVRELVNREIAPLLTGRDPLLTDLCRRIEPYGITWFEEPVYGNDPRVTAGGGGGRDDLPHPAQADPRHRDARRPAGARPRAGRGHPGRRREE